MTVISQLRPVGSLRPGPVCLPHAMSGPHAVTR